MSGVDVTADPATPTESLRCANCPAPAAREIVDDAGAPLGIYICEVGAHVHGYHNTKPITSRGAAEVNRRHSAVPVASEAREVAGHPGAAQGRLARLARQSTQ